MSPKDSSMPASKISSANESRQSTFVSSNRYVTRPDHFKTSQIWKEYGGLPCLRTFFDPGITTQKKYFTFVFKAFSTSSSTLSSSSSQSLIFECICNCQRFSEAFIAQTKQVLD